MKNSNENEKTMIAENFKKSLKYWKLPPSSSSDFFGRSDDGFCCIPDRRVKTVEKSISLPTGYSAFPLISNRRIRAHKKSNTYLHLGMIQVALKPAKLGLNSCAMVCLRDKRILPAYKSMLGMVESSLCDGPIYFSYFPDPKQPVSLSDWRDHFSIDVKIGGYEKIQLMYRFHYKVTSGIAVYALTEHFRNDEEGETTFFVTNIAQSNRVVPKKMRWDEIGISEEGLMVERDLPSSSSCGNASIDWKETAEEHVLKVDVPGLKGEEVRVEVEDGRIVQISGERREDRGNIDKWHCVERSSGRFLRRVTLPENAKLDQLKAAVENGVLTVTVPK